MADAIRNEITVDKKTSISAVCILDDDPAWLKSLEGILNEYGFSEVRGFSLENEFFQFLQTGVVNILILDLNLGNASGEEVLTKMTCQYPEIPVIVVSGNSDQRIAIDCMKKGAFNFFHKTEPVSIMIAEIKHALRICQLQCENSFLRDALDRQQVENPETFEGIVTVSGKMNAVFQYVETVSISNEPLLITGETGTGKELIAKAVHKASGRTGKFVSVNVAGVDDHVFGDSLFGHVKGAFTGATEDKSGFFEEAREGTLFLDEFGSLSFDSQTKLLRVIQEKEYYQLGDKKPLRSTAKIVAATNRPFAKLKDESLFRQDLFFRISTHFVELPPLRERREDIPFLVECFLEQAAEDMRKKKPTYSPELLGLLNTYHFPGNIRELRSMIFDAIGRHNGKTLSNKVFLERMRREYAENSNNGSSRGGRLIDWSKTDVVFSESLPTIDNLTDALVNEAMRRTSGNKTQAANMLGINRTTLVKRLGRKANV